MPGERTIKREMVTLDPEEISLVDEMAVSEEFLVVKSLDGGNTDEKEEAAGEQDSPNQPAEDEKGTCSDDDKEKQQASTHHSLLTEQLAAITNTAQKIATMAQSGNTDNIVAIQDLIYSLEQVTWGIEKNMSVIALSKQANDAVTDGRIGDALSHVSGAMGLLGEQVKQKADQEKALNEELTRIMQSVLHLSGMAGLSEPARAMATKIAGEIKTLLESAPPPPQNESGEETPQKEEGKLGNDSAQISQEAIELLDSMIDKAQSEESKAELGKLKSLLTETSGTTPVTQDGLDDQLKGIFFELEKIYGEEISTQKADSTGEVESLKEENFRLKETNKSLKEKIEKQTGKISPSNQVKTEMSQQRRGHDVTTWPQDMAADVSPK